MTYPDHVLLDRMRNVFDDTLEIADWFKQGPDDDYSYTFAETRTHLIGMWETMQRAADRMEDLIVEVDRLREALRHIVESENKEGDAWWRQFCIERARAALGNDK